MSMIGKKILMGLPVAILVAMLSPAPASANFWHGCNTSQPCPANSTHHIFYYSTNLGPQTKGGVEATRTLSFDNVPGWSTTTMEFHGSSDVQYYPGDLPTGTLARYLCQEPSGGVCNHGHIRFDWSNITAAGMDNALDLQALACAETAHSVGLGHPEDFNVSNDPGTYYCMLNYVYSGMPRYLGSHNVGRMTSEPEYS